MISSVWLALLLVCTSASVFAATVIRGKEGAECRIGLEPPLSLWELDTNTLHQIRSEVVDSNLLHAIAGYFGFAGVSFEKVAIKTNRGRETLSVVFSGAREDGRNNLCQRIEEYIRQRMDGRTKDSLLNVLTNRMNPAAFSDPDLQVLATNRLWLPLSAMTKMFSVKTTNSGPVYPKVTITVSIASGVVPTNSPTNQLPNVSYTNEITHQTHYTFIDGEIGWKLQVRFDGNGAYRDYSAEKVDAKDLDPRFKDVMKRVDSEVEQELRALGILGQLGAGHEFWARKREKLRALGIEWRSPAMLNRNIHYD